MNRQAVGHLVAVLAVVAARQKDVRICLESDVLEFTVTSPRANAGK
jgi:hypothetical protein